MKLIRLLIVFSNQFFNFVYMKKLLHHFNPSLDDI